MRKNNSILMVGPFPEPTTGVSVANDMVLNIFLESKNYHVRNINTSYNIFEESIGKFSIKKFLFYIALNFHFFKIFKCDILYYTPGQTFYGILKYSFFILLGSLLGKELIIHIHGNHLRNEYNSLKGIKKKIFHYLISKSTKGIVLSKSLLKNLTPFIEKSNIFILPNFAQEYLVKENTLKNYKELRIVFLSNLMIEKGIIVLLQTLKMLENKNIPYKAKIAGNLDMINKDKINSLLSQLKNTEYLGIVKEESKRDLLNWGNIFTLPTFYKMEGQPISILEAMATGNVIITTKHEGTGDIMQNNVHGFFVDKNDVISLEKIFIHLKNEMEIIRKISKSNKKYFQENFTQLQFKQRLLKILDC